MLAYQKKILICYIFAASLIWVTLMRSLASHLPVVQFKASVVICSILNIVEIDSEGEGSDIADTIDFEFEKYMFTI